MNTVELVHFSLGQAFEHLEQLVSDLTQEQADWLPPGNANSIGALYWHIIGYVDQLVHEWCMPPFAQIAIEEWFEARRDLEMGQVPLRHSAGWQEKVVSAFPPENPEDPYWDVRAVRQGLQVDLLALHDYAHATAQTLVVWVASLTPEDLERMIPTPFGDYNQGQFLEYFVVWHINDQFVHDEPQMPFGGFGDSGYGRLGGRAALEEFTELRWISFQRTSRHYPF